MSGEDNSRDPARDIASPGAYGGAGTETPISAPGYDRSSATESYHEARKAKLFRILAAVRAKRKYLPVHRVAGELVFDQSCLTTNYKNVIEALLEHPDLRKEVQMQIETETDERRREMLQYVSVLPLTKGKSGSYVYQIDHFPEPLRPFCRDMIMHDPEVSNAAAAHLRLYQAQDAREAQQDPATSQRDGSEQTKGSAVNPTLQGYSVEEQRDFLRRQSDIGRG